MFWNGLYNVQIGLVKNVLLKIGYHKSSYQIVLLLFIRFGKHLLLYDNNYIKNVRITMLRIDYGCFVEKTNNCISTRVFTLGQSNV